MRFCVDNPRNGENVLKSVLDGLYFKNHPFFSLHENALAIVLYYDETVLTNPLGSYTANHKLGMWYWSLANIYPEYRSSLQNVNLLAIVKYCDIQNHGGMEKILKKFVSEIKILQTNGIDIVVNDEIKNYKGSLILVAGDTPDSAWLGGFKKSVSATKLCRRCMTDNQFWKSHFNEKDFTLRSMETHREQVQVIPNPTLTKKMKQFWRKFYGLNEKTPLLDIEHFDVTKCLGQDMMHVLCEGVFEVEIRVFLEFCISKNCFDIEYLNQQIENFEYGHLQKDKPSLILREHLQKGLRQSTSQIVCLAYVLPFLIGDKLEIEDESDNEDNYALEERLFCHVQLVQIMNMCLAYTSTVDDAYFLSKLIETFLHNFKSLYPNSMVPKFHYLMHFPEQIIYFGPLRQHWCMRFEAAHAWFKSSAKILKNFKNMPKSLAYKHEAYKSVLLAETLSGTSPHFLYKGHTIKPGNTVMLADIANANLLINLLPGNIDPNLCPIMETSEVKVLGTIYKIGSIILQELGQNKLPKFGKVMKICIHERNIFLIFETLNTVEYSSKLNAYQLLPNTENIEYHALNIRNVLHSHPLSIFRYQTKQFVILMCHNRTDFTI